MAPKKLATPKAKEAARPPAAPKPSSVAAPTSKPASAPPAQTLKASAKVAAQPKPKAAPAADVPVEGKRKADGGEASLAPKKEPRLSPKEEPAAEFPELELDATEDKRPVFGATPPAGFFEPQDSTLNVVPTADGDVLMALSHGGLQYFVAGARASLGVKAGRCAFEVRVVDAVSPAEYCGAQRMKAPQPRQVLRVGVSTSGSPLVLGSTEDHVYFDLDGSFYDGARLHTSVAKPCSRDDVLTVVLNLDAASSNANTVSLFSNGLRVSQPQALPERLHDKPLFPHVAFRNLGLHVNLGPHLSKELPFKCRTVAGAAKDDLVSNVGAAAEKGKYEVLLPVAFPDEGTFDWLDTFLESNPKYTELSDRMLLRWAEASGLTCAKAPSAKNSNDKPEFHFGLPSVDDSSIQRVLGAIVAAVPRNYVVMEVKSNLVADERAETLRKFSAPHFRKVAHVVMGEPPQAFKAAQTQRFLREKQQKATEEWRSKKASASQQKTMAARQAKVADARKRADELRQRMAAEARRKVAAARKQTELAKRKAAGEEITEEEEREAEEDEAMKDETDVKEEEKDEDEKSDAPMDDNDDEGAPEVELTEEERSRVFRVVEEGSSDLSMSVLNKCFGKFSIPSSGEGFDDVRFEWQDEAASREYLRAWVFERKKTSRIEDLEPGEWFQELHKAWMKKFNDWQAKQKATKALAMRKEKEMAAKKKAEKEKAKEAGADEEAAAQDDDAAGEVDPFAVQDICDVGDGLPLFKDFAFEDWALLQLRYELYILQEAFRKDVDDPDIEGIQERHLPFYYGKYFRKQLVGRVWGTNTIAEVVALAKETVEFNSDGVLAPKLNAAVDDDSAEAFVKITEESRRERRRRTDAGDETAKLKFMPMALQQASALKPAAKVSAWGPGKPH